MKIFILNKNSIKNSFLNKLKLKNKFLCILFFFILFFSATEVNAITLNKSSYIEGEPIISTSSGGPAVIFNIVPESSIYYPILNVESYTANWKLNEYDENNPEALYVWFQAGEYAVLDLTDTGTGCYVNYLTYDECKISPEFVSEYIFTVTPLPSGGGGGDGTPILDEELTPSGGGGHSVTLYSPEVNIFSILKGALFSDNLVVDYKVTDQNDNGNERGTNGLGDKPVSIFYSDKITNWYDNFIGSSNKTEIAKEQLKEGKYNWSVKDLVPGVLYRIIVEAVDLAGLWGQSITDYFGVDFTAPVFTVNTTPEAVRSGEVVISIDSSEDLSDIPEVLVTQNGGVTKNIIVTGEKSHFEARYEVVAGFDGTASISVKGVDLAGNEGELIVGGGTFSVGVNPPAKPVINKYQEKIVTDKDSIDVNGTTRVDTEVVLRVNGVEISKVKPDVKGNFSFNKILLDKKKNKGINYLNIYSRDPLGSLSVGVPIEVKYNIAPNVKIVKPIDKDLLSNISPINVEGRDENGDTLFYTYQVLSKSNYDNKILNWSILSKNDPSSTFSWNTTEVEDGKYVIGVIANDGNIKTISDTVQVSVKNVLPYFRFENGRNTITNNSSINIKGKALTSVNISPRPDIVSVAYSMDQGNTWTPVKTYREVGNYQKKFAVEFSNLKEGIYPILWRTKDTRGFIGKIVHSIIVDKTAPKAPIVTNLKKEKGKDILINNDNDENLNKSGVQISIKGKAEPESVVTLVYDNKIFITKSFATGDFVFNDFTFETKGRYELSLYAKDSAGNKSIDTPLSIIYNNLPTISFINPKSFGGLSGVVDLSWTIKDIDGDQLKNIVISYRDKEKDKLFKTIVSDVNAIGNYSWDTSLFPPSNNYELKISAEDVYSSISSVVSFSVDRTPPIITSLSFDKNEQNLLNKKISFVFKGDMTDNLSGLEYVEYSIEDSNGKVSPWYKGLITSGYLKNKAEFVIKHPLMKEDGVYKINVRAVDRASNVGEGKTLLLSIDKTAPRIGGFFLEKDGIALNPDDSGDIIIYKNSIFHFNVSLEKDTESASVKIGDEVFPLKREDRLGLWGSDISLPDEIKKKIFVTVSDFSGNILKDSEVGSVTASPRGTVFVNKNDVDVLVVGASIRVEQFDKERNEYTDFSIKNSNTNIVNTNQSGEYDLVLPAGVYRFIITGDNIGTLKYKSEVSRPSIVSLDFKVSPLSGFKQFINNFLSIFK